MVLFVRICFIQMDKRGKEPAMLGPVLTVLITQSHLINQLSDFNRVYLEILHCVR